MSNLKFRELLLLVLPVIALAGIGIALRGEQATALLPQKWVRINDSETYISANPLKFGEEIRYSYKMPQEQRAILEQELTNTKGPGGITIQPKGMKPTPLSSIRVQSAYIEREVEIKQGAVTLFRNKSRVTSANLVNLTDFRLSSNQWTSQPALLGKNEIAFSVNYSRHYKLGGAFSSNGRRTHVSHTTLIPIK